MHLRILSIMVIFTTCTAAGMDVCFCTPKQLLKVCLPVCLSSHGNLRMPHLQGMCANSSLGQTVLMLLILYKSHDPYVRAPSHW